MTKSSALGMGLWLLAGALIGMGAIDLIYRPSTPAVETQRDVVFPRMPPRVHWRRVIN